MRYVRWTEPRENRWAVESYTMYFNQSWLAKVTMFDGHTRYDVTVVARDEETAEAGAVEWIRKTSQLVITPDHPDYGNPEPEDEPDECPCCGQQRHD